MNKDFNTKYQPIENYGIVGNLHTVALISHEGSIDFMSFVRFDSPTIFCKLLDADKGGSFSIRPVIKDVVKKQLYLPDTNVLITRFLAEEGIAEVTDFMPINEAENECRVIRKITTIRGKIDYEIVCAPRFNYARGKHKLKQEGNSFLFVPDQNTQPPVRLRSNIELTPVDNDINSKFTLIESETAYFILEADITTTQNIKEISDYVESSYTATVNYWKRWIAKSTYRGRWQEIVNRSALTLKLLSSRHYGSMVASPTFSLPESIGNSRNWDYRYTWIRDAAFSMYAFLQLGFMDEAASFLLWVKKQSTDKELQLMFSIDGKKELDEVVLDNLEGYKKSWPVRIGNDAHKQIQMDIYGELLETIYVYVIHGGDITYDYWKIITQYIEDVMLNWHKPDHSIWEVRGEKREFIFSRLMCWVAMDRAIKIATHYSFPYDILNWHKVRDEIYTDVYENFWNEEKQSYVQFKGSSNLDASVLLMPVLNIISPVSERWQKTMQAIDKELKSDVLIYRYKQTEKIDGLKGKEGTFSMCSFWYVECLALSGEIAKAREHFEKMLGYANHLGLFAEQLGIKGEFLGNYPQAFTHLALISAAIELNKTKRADSAKAMFSEKKMK